MPMSPRNTGMLLSNTNRGPVRLAWTPTLTGPRVPVAEAPQVYFGEPDSRLPAVNAQFCKPVTLVGSTVSQVTPVGRRPVWMLSWILLLFHDPNTYSVTSLIGW